MGNWATWVIMGLLWCWPLAPGRAEAPPVLMEYSGSYTCIQGLTRLTLRVLRPSNASDPNVIFAFGPDVLNPRVPNGEDRARGSFDVNGGPTCLDARSLDQSAPGVYHDWPRGSVERWRVHVCGPDRRRRGLHDLLRAASIHIRSIASSTCSPVARAPATPRGGFSADWLSR